MGWFDRLKINKKDNKKEQNLNNAATMTGTTPIFYSNVEDIMDDETVWSIVNRILEEYSKLNPRHIRTINGKSVKVSDNNINNILAQPNAYMTKVDFLRKIAYIRERYDNVFIYPTYDLWYNKKTGQKKKVYTGLYPLKPTMIKVLEDDRGTLFIQFQLPSGEYSEPVLFDEVIIWRKNYGENDYLGGDKNGRPNNTALINALQLTDKLQQSTLKAIEGSLAVKGVLKYGSIMNEEDREKARQKFEESLKNNSTGIIALDLGGDYINIPTNTQLIDKDTLDYFKTIIRQHYGVSEAILNGDYTAEQKEAFYETVIEAGVLSLGEAFTRVMLTPFERSNGNEIICYTNKIQMMSADKKVQLANLLLPIGAVSGNEIRSWFGIEPIEGGDEPMMSLNWVKKSIADEYQLETYKENDTNSKKNNTNDTNGGIIEEDKEDNPNNE